VLIDNIDLQKFALLLDVDGTLLDIAPTPLAVQVPERLKRALSALAEQTAGATAFVSGRPLAQLDLLFAPLTLPAVGGHGAELRLNGIDAPQRFDMGLSDDLRGQLEAFAGKLDGVLLEDKGFSIALHYRLAPQHAAIVREAVAAACAPYPDGSIEVLLGKSVIEVKPAAFDKGTGIRGLMSHAPFHGRRPLFIGDDITDEAAFAVLPDYDGVGFSVGRRIKGLAGCIPKPSDVRHWLYRTAESSVAVDS
jgi:trehalose 6-phosphate phosphatase